MSRGRRRERATLRAGLYVGLLGAPEAGDGGDQGGTDGRNRGECDGADRSEGVES